jgi:phosphomannomutase
LSAFRAYDVRGVYGTEVTEELVERVGSAFGSCFDRGNISLGRDSRISGPRLQKAFIKGVLSTGCNIQSYGIIPIPVLSYITWKECLDAAAYISASHNPAKYNGIRFRTGDGYGMLYKETKMMEYYSEGKFLKGNGSQSEKDPTAALDRYGDYVSEKLNIQKKLNVVLDFGNGSACSTGPIYEKAGINVIKVNETIDGEFPGRGPSPTEESLQEASMIIAATKADFGVGFDPDADRGLIVDDLGRIVPPEKVAIIIAKRRYKPGDLIISGFDCSMILERELEPEGFKIKRERVGDVFIANRVKNSGAVLGVERSAHFFLPEFQYSDDPFAMSLVLGEIISEGEKLSTLADEIPDYPYKQISIRLNEGPAGVMLRLKDALAAMQPNTLDGLKITTDSYSVLIRPSNTEPILRLYIETAAGDMKELAERYEKIIHRAMKA